MLAEELEHSTVSAEAYHEKTRALEQALNDLRESQRRLQELVDLDPLTGVPNRRLFDDRLSMLLQRCRRDKRRAAVVYVDIDGFKPVNDQYGHGAGDQVLADIARRLQRCLRKTDTVSRIGGDEFALLLDPGPPTGDTAEIAAKILAALRVPFEVDGVSIQLDASIGIAFFPDNGDSAKELLKAADSAMYLGKSGPESVVFASGCPRDGGLARLSPTNDGAPTGTGLVPGQASGIISDPSNQRRSGRRRSNQRQNDEKSQGGDIDSEAVLG